QSAWTRACCRLSTASKTRSFPFALGSRWMFSSPLTAKRLRRQRKEAGDEVVEAPVFLRAAHSGPVYQRLCASEGARSRVCTGRVVGASWIFFLGIVDLGVRRSIHCWRPGAWYTIKSRLERVAARLRAAPETQFEQFNKPTER